nr:ammonium transporter Rh type A-like [Biomphalaria glabrata]
MVSVWLSKLKFPLTIAILQVLFIILYAVFIDYDATASPPKTAANSTQEESGAAMVHKYYAMFQDVHVMMFIGFGFLMMFLRRYGFSSVGLNMLIAALCIQWSTLIGGIIHHHGDTFTVSITTMLTSDFASASILITFGALLGKTSPLQMVFVTMFGIVLFAANEYIGLVVLQAVDVGGSMFVHAFGAYFGLTISRVLYNAEVEQSKKENSVYHSDMFAVVGTIFLWLFWPSFNSALAVEDAQHRAVLNTYYALAACCLVTFAISSLVDKDGKFDMVHIQNATLAGGVAVGTSADMMIRPYGALIIGSVAAVLSTLGYKYVTPFLKSKLKIHDTCGVNNLHGMPAIMAGLAGAITVAMADTDTYGYTLYRQFPAMAPEESTQELAELNKVHQIEAGQGRSAKEQAVFQLIALVVTLGFALVGGLFVGLLLKFCQFLGQPSGDKFFDDSLSWHVPPESNSEASLDGHGANSSASKADTSRSALFSGHVDKADMTLEESAFLSDDKV